MRISTCPPANGGAAGAGTVVDRLARLLDGPALPSTPPDLLTAIGRATDGRATGTLLVVCAASGACAPEDVADGADRLRDGDRLPLLRGWSVDMIGTVGAGRGAEPPGYTASGAWGSVLRAAGADPVRVDLAPLPAPDPMDVPAVTWAPRSVPEPDVPAPAAPDLPFGGEYLAARFLVGELGFAGESVTVSLRGAELLRIAGEGIAGRSARRPGSPGRRRPAWAAGSPRCVPSRSRTSWSPQGCPVCASSWRPPLRTPGPVRSRASSSGSSRRRKRPDHHRRTGPTTRSDLEQALG